MYNNPNLGSFDAGVQTASDTQKQRFDQMSKGLEQERQDQRQKLQDQRQAIFDQIRLQQHQMKIEDHQRAIEDDKTKAILNKQKIAEGEQRQQEIQAKQLQEDQNVYTKALLNSQGFSDSEVAEQLGILPNLPENYSQNLDSLIPLLDKAVANIATDRGLLVGLESNSKDNLVLKGKKARDAWGKELYEDPNAQSKLQQRLATIDKNFSLDDLIKSNGDLSAFLGSHYGKELIDEYIKERVPKFDKLKDREKNALRNEAKNDIAQTYLEASGNLSQLVQKVMSLGGEKNVASIYNKFLAQGGLRNVRNREEMVKALRRAVGFSNDPRVLKEMEELKKLPRNLNELRPDHPIYTTPPPLPPRGLKQVDDTINKVTNDLMQRPEVQKAIAETEAKSQGYAANMKKRFKDMGYPDDMVEEIYQDARAREITGSMIATPIRNIVNGVLNVSLVPASNKAIDASNAVTDSVSKLVGSKTNKLHISDKTKQNVREFLHWSQSEEGKQFAKDHPNIAMAADLTGWIGLGVASGGLGLGLGVASEAAAAGGKLGGTILRATGASPEIIKGMESIGTIASKALNGIESPVLRRAILWAADQGIISGITANANTEGDAEFSERMSKAGEGALKGAAIGAGFSLGTSLLGKIAGRLLSKPLRHAGAKENFTDEIIRRGEEKVNKEPFEEDLANLTSDDEINARQVDIQKQADKSLKIVEDRKQGAINQATRPITEQEEARAETAKEGIKNREKAIKQGNNEEGADYVGVEKAVTQSVKENKRAIPEFNRKYRNELKELLPEEASKELLNISSNFREKLNELINASKSNFYVAGGLKKLKNIADIQNKIISGLGSLEIPSNLERELLQEVESGEVFKKSYNKDRLNQLKKTINPDIRGDLQKVIDNPLTYKDLMDLYRANNAEFGKGDFEKGVGRNLRSSLQKLFKDKDTTSKFFKDFENANDSYKLGLTLERIAKPNEQNPTLDTKGEPFKGRGKEILGTLRKSSRFTAEPLFLNERMEEILTQKRNLERIATPTRTKPFTEVDDDFEDDFKDDFGDDFDEDNDIPEENEIMLPSKRQEVIDRGILQEAVYDIEKDTKSPDRRIRDYQELLKENSPLSSVLARDPEMKQAMEDRVEELNDELEMIEDLITEDRNWSEEAAKEVRRTANEIAQSQEYKDIVDQINQLTQEMKDEAASQTPEVSEMLKSIYDRFQEKDKIPEIIDNLTNARDKNVTKYKETLKQLQEELKKIDEYVNDPDKLVDDIVKEMFRGSEYRNLGLLAKLVTWLATGLGRFVTTKDTILMTKNKASIEMAKDFFRKKFGKDIPESDIDKIIKALYNNDRIAQFLVNMMKLFSMVAASPARNDDDQSER